MAGVSSKELYEFKKTLKEFKIEYSGVGETVIYMSPEPGYYVKKGGIVKLMLK